MSGRRLALCFAAAFLAALLLFVPLQLLLPGLSLPHRLGATEVSGTPWRGHLHQARWDDVALGDVRVGLAPLPLLAGRNELRLHGAQFSLALSGGRLRGVANANGTLPLPTLQGLALRASLADARMLFDAGACREAGGRVRIELTLPGDARPPLLLAGTPACEGRVGVLTLVPEDAAAPVRVEATLSVEADGRYLLQARARSDDPAVAVLLAAHGFQDAPGGMSRVVEGRLGNE